MPACCGWNTSIRTVGQRLPHSARQRWPLSSPVAAGGGRLRRRCTRPHRTIGNGPASSGPRRLDAMASGELLPVVRRSVLATAGRALVGPAQRGSPGDTRSYVRVAGQRVRRSCAAGRGSAEHGFAAASSPCYSGRTSRPWPPHWRRPPLGIRVVRSVDFPLVSPAANAVRALGLWRRSGGGGAVVIARGGGPGGLSGWGSPVMAAR